MGEGRTYKWVVIWMSREWQRGARGGGGGRGENTSMGSVLDE